VWLCGEVAEGTALLAGYSAVDKYLLNMDPRIEFTASNKFGLLSPILEAISRIEFGVLSGISSIILVNDVSDV
jgi:hypothetical protein